jgi:predicted PurR-regulated permease PerM
MSLPTPHSTSGSPDAGATGSRPFATPPVHHERRSKQMGWRSEDILRTAALVTALYVGVRLVWFAHLLLFVAFLGTLFGLAVTAGVDRLARYRIPRGVAAPLIVFGTLGIIVAFFAWAAPTLRAQSHELRTKLPEAVDKFDGWLEAHRGGVVGMFLTDTASAVARGTEAPTGSAAAVPSPRSGQPGDTSARVERQLAPNTGGSAIGAAAPTGSMLRHRLLHQFSGVSHYLFPVVTSAAAAVGGLLMLIFLSVYIGADPQTYHDGIMQLFPHGARRRAGEVLTAIASTLRRWLLTQLIAMLTIGTVTTIVLLLLGVKAAFPLGILAGLFEFIPTVGPILSATPAIAMGFVDSPEKALWVGLAYVGIQFLENHLIVPLLMKQGVNLPPALTVISQATMALVFGFIGLLVAVPFLAAVSVVVKMLYVEDVVGEPDVLIGSESS